MAAETLIQVDAAEACYSLQCLLKELLFQDSEKVENIPIICKTDSRQLNQAVHSVRAIEDKRLRREIAILREMLERKELSEIKWIDHSLQLADNLTKEGSSLFNLLNTLVSGKFPK